MGGKTSTSSSSVKIPPEVLARYNSVNKRAEAVATQPFQKYSTDPNAFVAPINEQQYAGIGGINNAANMAQPYYGTAAEMTLSGAGAVNPQQYSSQAVQKYMNPYISNVADTTAAQMKNLYGQQAEELKGGAIRSGAFGGDRAGIAQGNLANQQGLAFGQQMANIYGTGFNQAQQQFNNQQQVNLQADQANQARMLAAGQQLGGLGAGAQAAALQGAQAQLGAGTLEQQTQQAGQTALYNQFLQQQAYPFQIAQFLGNIAMGTGALSGSSQTMTQPAPFFSDERVKDNIEPIGETYDGQKIVKFNYKGDKQKQIGLIAQDVERHHPEAVGLAGGIKTVDYDGATKQAARMGKYAGGLASEGGAVHPLFAGQGYAAGGAPAGIDTSALQGMIAQQMAMPSSAPAGGVNAGLAQQARDIAPQPIIPSSVTAPVFNPQPIPGSGTTTTTQGGKGESSTTTNTPDFTNWSDYLAGIAAGKDMNDPSLLGNRINSANAAGLVSNENNQHPNHNDRLRNTISGGGGGDHYSNRNSNTYNAGIDAGVGGDTGLAAGYAAANDHTEEYAYGGSVEEALARQAQMYAALDQSTVPTTRQLTAGIGKHGRVPEANLPVHNLKTPDLKPEQQKSMLDEGMSAYEKGAKLAEMFQKARSGLQSLGSNTQSKVPSVPSVPAGTSSATTQPKAEAPASGLSGAEGKQSYVSPEFEDETSFGLANRGGRMKRAIGGFTVPYTDDEASSKKLDIPNEVPDAVLPKQNQPSSSGQQSGLNTIMQLASLGKMILPFLAEGGRVHKEGGGPAENGSYDDAWKKIINIESSGKHFDKNGMPLTSKTGAIGIAQVQPTTAPEAARMAGVQFDENRYKNDPSYNEALGKAYFGHQIKTFGDLEKAAAAYNAGPGRVSNALKKASETGADWRAFLPKETRDYIAKFSGPSDVPSKNAKAAEGFVIPGEPAPQPKEEGLGSKIGMNEETLVPLLAGLGSMVSSRSPYLASAIGEGVVGGVGAYTGLKGLNAEVAQRKAQTEETYSNIARNSAVFSPTGETFFLTVGPNGYEWMDEAKYRSALEAGNPPKVDPRGQNWKQNNLPAPPFVKNGEQETPAPGLGGAPAPAATTEGGLGGQPAPAPAPQATTAPTTENNPPAATPAPPSTTPAPVPASGLPAPVKIGVTPDILPEIQKARKEIDSPVFGKETQAQIDENAKNAQRNGQAAEQIIPGLMVYGAEMSMRPRTNEFMDPGTGGKALHEIAKGINWVSSNILKMGTPIAPADINNQEAILKQFGDMRAAAAAANNQEAVAALDKMAEQFPGLSTTHGASGKTLAKMVVDKQFDAEYKKFLDDWAANAKRMGAKLPMLTTQQALDIFKKKYSGVYQEDRDMLEKLYNQQVLTGGSTGEPVKAPAKGQIDERTGKPAEWRPYTWWSYLQERGQTLSPAQYEYVIKTFGPNIIRYFPNIKVQQGAQ